MTLTDWASQDALDKDMYRADPHPYFRWLREHAPVHQDPLGVWVVAKHEDVKWCERQPAIFSNANGSRPNSGPQPSLIDSDDPWHAAQRRLVAQGFTHRQMQAYEAHVRVVTRQLVDRVEAEGRCDVVADLARPLPMTLIGEMLGAPAEDYERLQHWSDEMITGADKIENVTEATMNAAFAFYEYIAAVIAQRRADPGPDLVSALIHGEADGQRLDDAHLVGNALLLLVGGNETTRNVIAGGLHAMLAHPEQMAIARASLEHGEFLGSAIEECLRWVTPVNHMNRTTTAEVEVRGVTIPAGSQVLMAYLSANRDEDVFDRPFSFDVTRQPNPHLAFGFGPHLCLGAQLARLELRLLFEAVVSRLPRLRLAEPDTPPVYSHSSFVRGITSLRVRFD